jgi:trans-2-enoyl-CoA reductase
MKKSRAIVFHEHGNPSDVLKIEEQELPSLGENEALVEMLAAPINPVDLNVIEGKYPVHPPLPAVAGTEGVGVIKELGNAAHGLRAGEQVLLPQGVGTWRETLTVNAEMLIRIPSSMPIQQAAMLRINPPTAWRMLHDFVELKQSDWIMQNAANSGVGLAVLQIAKSLGVKTVNVVRRPELIEELQREGGDVVLLESEDVTKQIAEATNNAPIRLALNAVGGDSALRLANALAPGGTIVTYGAMGRQPLRIPNGLLIFKDLRWRGFWVTQWYQHASTDESHAMFEQLFPLAENGKLRSPIEREYSIDQASEAIQRAQQSRRAGKILFRFNA